MTVASESFLSIPRISTTESTVVRVIAVFKLLKCLLFLGSALAISRIVHQGVEDAVASWLAVLHIDPQSHWLQWVMAKVSGISHNTFRLIAAGSFLYAAIYLIEGIGLWLDRPWAEWLTIVASLLLVPVEIYEIYERVTPIRIGILIINLVIVAFLIHHVRLKRRIAQATKQAVAGAG